MLIFPPITVWILFEIKEKPAGNAQANLVLKKGGKGTGFAAQDLPPLDKKEIERLKKEASTTKFTTASFKAHMKKCNEASWNKQSGRLCYWCIEANCLHGRRKQFINQDKANICQKGEDYGP